MVSGILNAWQLLSACAIYSQCWVLTFSSDLPHCRPTGLLAIRGLGEMTQAHDQGMGKERFSLPPLPLGEGARQFKRRFKFKLCFLVSYYSFKGKLKSIFYNIPSFFAPVNTNDY